MGEATQSVNIHILLDRSRSLAWEAGQKPIPLVASSSKWDGARRLAGAMGYLALASGEKLQITPFARTLDQSFGPTRGKRQVIATLQFLTDISPAPRLTRIEQRGPDLAHNLAAYSRAYRDGGLLVLISDLLDTDPDLSDPPAEGQDEAQWGRDLAEGLRCLPPPRWQVVVMHLLTEQEMKPTLEGDFDLQDVETGENLPFYLGQQTRSQYQQRMRRWCADLESACTRRGAVYTRVLAEWPLEKAVIPYLWQRGVVK